MIGRRIIVLPVVVPLVGWLAATAGQSYKLQRYVTPGGGGRANSTSFKLMCTMGQPSPVGASQSGSYKLKAGFLWGAAAKVAIKSLSYDPLKGVTITWESVAGAKYAVQYTDDLTAAWTTLVTLTGTGTLMEWLDDGTLTALHPSNVPKRFYRLRIEE